MLYNNNYNTPEAPQNFFLIPLPDSLPATFDEVTETTLNTPGLIKETASTVLNTSFLISSGGTCLAASSSSASSSKKSVCGPKSALTSFLEERGISAQEIRRRHMNQYSRSRGPSSVQQNLAISFDHVNQSSVASNSPQKDDSGSDIKNSVKVRVKKKNSDDTKSDSDGSDNPSSIFCVMCRRPLPNNMLMSDIDPRAPKCSLCWSILSKKMKSRKGGVKRMKNKCIVAGTIRQTTHIPTLQDICVKFIGKNIKNVETFGHIGSKALNIICSCLCKLRLLNEETFRLFVEYPTTSLTLYDCAKLTRENLKSIGWNLPKLVSLTLEECGQLDDEILKSLSNCCPLITRFCLNGAHLVSDEALSSFIASRALTEFEVSYNSNIAERTVRALFKEGNKLSKLCIAKCANIKDYCFSGRLDSSCLSALTYDGLAISSDAYKILNRASSEFYSLKVVNCSPLVENSLPIINKILPKLTSLELDLRIFSSVDKIKAFLNELTESTRLEKLFLYHCAALDDGMLCAILKENAGRLTSLTMSEGTELTVGSLSLLSSCRLLEKLDLSWCGRVNNEIVASVVRKCERLQEVALWGCHRITESLCAYTKGRVDIKGAMFA
ncbi:uncharacterized protein LOC135121349 [Zophobas morio]|uniref:uncharacterized protein LOC135121349 n=1 Tax=Zophobas morio TaxID=2755281 RepID=UPI0030829B39